jgi:hypothetical protein
MHGLADQQLAGPWQWRVRDLRRLVSRKIIQNMNHKLGKQESEPSSGIASNYPVEV